MGGLALDFASDPVHVDKPFDSAIEPDTGLPRTEAGKRDYFAKFGSREHQLQGFDSSLDGWLKLCEQKNFAASWSLLVGPEHCNSYGSLHGGCIAALVDVLGSSVVAVGNADECGMATNLDVQY